MSHERLMRFCHGANANRGGLRRQRMRTGHFAAGGRARRYRTEAWLKNRAWSSGGIADTVGAVHEKRQRGAGGVACLRRVCYKFVAAFWLTTKCLSSIFLRAKSTASWCITVQVWAEKPRNLQWIYDHTGQNQKGKMVSLATETDRTLFFDFLPLDLGTVRGFKTRFHLYTVPGQVFL